MPDRFSDQATGLDSPATLAFAVTPNDGADLTEVTRALYVGGGGTIVAVLSAGSEVTFTGIAGGSVLPIRVRRIKAAGTTATAILGLL